MAAAQAGADFIGFVFFEKSPRNVSLQQAAELAAFARAQSGGPKTVGLFVRQSAAEIAETVRAAGLDVVQLHGTYGPADVAAVRAATGAEIWTARGISAAEDFAALDAFVPHTDRFLFDAKPPKDAARPGGNALRFDWSLLTDRRFARPWMLAGGLEPVNVADAIRLSGATAVDVSSGVEDAPGVKSAGKIAAFTTAAKAAG